jgi:UDP-glucose/galactose:(glucosyl)LPS alpha-1,2-glucosyl/galactosyltransferase
MDVLFCFDENYEQHFGVAATSLILNNREHIKNIHIVSNKISSQFHQKLEQFKSIANVEFSIYPINEQQIKNLKIAYHISPASYYRFLAADILPANINKVLYLDCDLIVNGSITELYNHDISKYLVGAFCGDTKVITTKKRLNLTSDYYFNAGVILINLEAWRRLNIGQKCIEFLRDYPEIAILLDQDALNKVIDGNFLHIDKKWNSLIDLYGGTSELDDKSIIIHFIGSLKPWQIWCMAKEREIYWSYLKKSPWSDCKPELPNNTKKLASAIKSIFKQLKYYK